MDFTKLLVLCASFRDAVAQKKVWQAVSLAAQIAGLVAQIVTANSGKAVNGIVGFEELQRELQRLQEPDTRTRLTAASAPEHNLTGFSLDPATLAMLLQFVISLLQSLLNRAAAPQPAFKPKAKAEVATPPAEATDEPVTE